MVFYIFIFRQRTGLNFKHDRETSLFDVHSVDSSWEHVTRIGPFLVRLNFNWVMQAISQRWGVYLRVLVLDESVMRCSQCCRNSGICNLAMVHWLWSMNKWCMHPSNKIWVWRKVLKVIILACIRVILSIRNLDGIFYFINANNTRYIHVSIFSIRLRRFNFNSVSNTSAQGIRAFNSAETTSWYGSLHPSYERRVKLNYIIVIIIHIIICLWKWNFNRISFRINSDDLTGIHVTKLSIRLLWWNLNWKTKSIDDGGWAKMSGNCFHLLNTSAMG